MLRTASARVDSEDGAQASPPSSGRAELIGRGDELAALLAAFEQVVEGQPATVLIGGDAGIGKTSLLRAFTAAVGDRGRVLVGGSIGQGTADQGGDGVPFAPFTAALRGLGPARIAALLPIEARSALPHLLPTLGTPDHVPGTDVRPVLFEQVLTLLATLSRTQPTVLVIEDAHWASGSTRELLDFLVRNQQAAPGLMIVVTARSTALVRTDPVRQLLAELDRIVWVSRNELTGLTHGEVALQMRGILGHEPDPLRVDEIHRRSQGNPLFVEALLDDDSGDTLLGPLQDLLLSPVVRLPADARDVVRAIAVGGSRVEHRLLEAVAELDAGGLSGALDAAVAAMAIAVEGDAYVFRHALIREAVYTDLLPGDRMQLHRRFARALEADPALGGLGPVTAQLAHHWDAAGEVARALVAAWTAAEEARTGLAFAEQLALLERVIDLWDDVPDAAASVGIAYGDVLVRAATAARRAGNPERGVELATAALGVIDDDVASAYALELRSGMRAALGRGGDLQDLEDAERLAASDPVCLARVLGAKAVRLSRIPRQDEAVAAAGRALEVARAAGDPASEMLALTLLATLRSRVSGVDGELPALHEAQRLAASLGDDATLLRAIHAEAHLLEAFGAFEEAVEVARRGLGIATDAGRARSAGGPHAVVLVGAYISLGRWDDAIAEADRMLQLAPPPIIRAELLTRRAAVALARGDHDLVRPAIRAATELSDAGANLWYPAAQLDVALRLGEDDAPAAAAAIDRALGGPRPHDASRYAWPFLTVAARVPSHLDLDAGRALASRLQELAAELPVVGPVQDAYQRTFAAELGYGIGHRDGEVWGAAVQAWAQVGDPYLLAHVRRSAAEVALTVTGDREVAADWLRRASDAAELLFARPLYAEVARLARRARITLEPGVEGGETDETLRRRLGLTARELEVLSHLADGRSNNDVATHLFISPKTVSVHVSRILAKLGLANRTEAAAMAHRLGLGATADLASASTRVS